MKNSLSVGLICLSLNSCGFVKSKKNVDLATSRRNEIRAIYDQPDNTNVTNIFKDKFGAVYIDSSFKYKQVDIDKKGVPEEVRKEANNPSLLSGVFSYSPAESLEFVEWNLGMKYVLPMIPLFIGGELEVPLEDVRTDDGELGRGYSYAQLIGGNTGVRYFYGIRYRPQIIKPMAGFRYEIYPSRNPLWGAFIEPSVKYDRLNLKYIKGIESFKDHHDRFTIAKQNINIFEIGTKLGLLIKSEASVDKMEHIESNGFRLGKELRKTRGLIGDVFRFGIFLYGGGLLTDRNGIDGFTIGGGLNFSF